MADEKSDGESAGHPMIDGMLAALVESGEAQKMQGLDIDDLRAAMSAPGAVETIMEVQALGAASAAGPGELAPDFDLPYLPDSPRLDSASAPHSDRVRLSERFANRPVALIFGSYT